MTKDILTIDSESTILEACEIFTKHNIGCLVVKNNKVVVGLITEQNIIQTIIISNGDPKKTKVKEIMTPKFKTIHATSLVDKAAEIMEKHKINKLPVVKNNDIIGIVTETDLSRTIPIFLETIGKLNQLHVKSRQSIDKIMDEWEDAIVKLKDHKKNKKL